ncbi:MAG: hypothetical protein QNK23_13840 [Crocinitomicaceae bacterium]|nr:hypothetical protein [Crocinitomicaceae bacterium]
MATANPMNSLAEVKSWLETITAASSVTVASSQFDAKLVNDLFTLIPDTDSLSLTGVQPDADTYTLVGTGNVLGENSVTMTLIFSEITDEDGATPQLALDFEMNFSPVLSWTLIDSFNLVFEVKKAEIKPNADLDVLGMIFTAELKTTTSDANTTPLSIPIGLAIPTSDSDWLLTANIDSPVNSMSDTSLADLAGNSAISTLLPTKLLDFSYLSLNSFEMSFNPLKGTCSNIQFEIGYSKPGGWQFISDNFIVDGIVLDFGVSNVFGYTADKLFEAGLVAKMTIDGVQIEVGGQFPDKSVYARLEDGSSINLTALFEYFGVPGLDGFPDVNITTLDFTFFTESSSFLFNIGIGVPIPLVGNVALDNFYFGIDAEDMDSNSSTVSGELSSQFSIGDNTKLLLSGKYATGDGVTLTGEIKDLMIGELITDLGSKFGIDDLPDFIKDIVLDDTKITYNTSSSDFTFDCSGHTSVANNDLKIDVSISALTKSDKYVKNLKGTLEIGTETFTIDFETGDDTKITATWDTKGELSLETIANALGIDAPTIPHGLDLSLKSAKLEYNSTNSTFLIEAEASLGNAVFVATKNPADESWVFFFGLKTGRTIDLSNLPIIDKVSSVTGTLAVQNIEVDIASIPIVDGLIKTINDVIGDSDYPQVPENGMSGNVSFSMEINIGGDITLLSLGANDAGETEGGESRSNEDIVTADSGSSDDDTVYWYKLEKSFGPLYFQKIGVAYKDSKIFFMMNVSATASGLTLSLDGLGIGVSLTDFDPTFTIDGIGITYASGPILISGHLMGSISPVNLTGDILIKTETITIGGIAGYTEVEGKPSLFLYAVLDIPLGGPPYFFVTGLAAGFGFNRKLLLPDIDGVDTFPFVEWAMGIDAPSSEDDGNIAEKINSVLTDLLDKGIVAPELGTNWLTAGVKFTTFEMLDSFAMLNIVFGTDVEIALLGLSKLTIPVGANAGGGSVPVVVFAELALKAAYSFNSGLLSIQGQLTSSSYVLSKDCHITGGFAFFAWFKGQHAGDFVVSLGGYNDAYTVPSHYPTVPRLGMNWQVTSDLVIKGGEYFALTSNAVMAGGYMEASWSSGGIKAWFDVQADFLIMWKPFHYDIRASVDIGASFKINLLFTSVKITIHVGVGLHIWGPDFTGTATIDLDIISFTIKFGSGSSSKPKTISWAEFTTDLLPQKKVSAVANNRDASLVNEDASSPDPDVCKIAMAEGLIKELSTEENKLNWVVNGEKFELTVSSNIPSKTSSFSANLALSPTGQPTKSQNKDFGVRPVGIAAKYLDSQLNITISSNDESSSTFHAVKIQSSVAKGLWEKISFDSSNNPIVGNPVADTTLDNVLTGFTIVPYVAPPDHTLPIDLVNLQYTIDPNLQEYSWASPVVATSDPFDGLTVYGTIEDSKAVTNRAAILDAIKTIKDDIDTSINVRELSSAASYSLLAEPEFRLIGEEKI